jgi:phenylpropionate dioxygenase-like ring-hydroxylating dioxygenase large terminal subunit
MNEMLTIKDVCASEITRVAGLDTGPVPCKPYYDPAYFELERENLFKRAWLTIGRIEQLPEPGSFVTKFIEIWNAPIFVTRDKDDHIQAFYNVCAHRGNQVVLEARGKAGRFSCGYHGWTYRNSGELVGIPDEANFYGVEKQNCGLRKIATAVWEGWIFINHQPEPEVSLETFLGGFGKAFTGMVWGNSDKSILFEAHLNANWKVIADAFAETYHIPVIHPATIGTTFSNKLNPHSRPISAEFWGPHRQVSTFGDPDYAPPTHAKVEQMAYADFDNGNVLGAAQTADTEAFRAHPAVNPTRSKHWAVDVTWAFPNFHIDLSPGGFWSHRFWPVSANLTRWEAEFHIPDALSARQRLQQELYVARLAEILLEDVTNTERTQRGIESGAFEYMQLQDGEVMIRHSLHHVDKWVKAKTVAEALAG